MNNLYNLKSTPTGFAIAKFNENLEVEAAYTLEPFAPGASTYTCSCPAGPRPSCRHRNMLPRMLPKADTAQFYCYETQLWMTPIPFDDGSHELSQEVAEVAHMDAAAGGLNKDKAGPDEDAAFLKGLVHITTTTIPEVAGEAPRDQAPPSPTIRRR